MNSSSPRRVRAPQTPPPALKRSVSGESHNSYASAATTASRASSKLLFGEIPLTPATTVDGRSTRSNSSICNLVLSTSSSFLRFWLNDNCRDNLLGYLETEDLPNCRLVCHDFATRAAPFLFESLTVTFKPSTFSKPARMEALNKIGHHVKKFTFHMPHSPETLLPPLIDPVTGTEKQFIYEPQLQTPQPHTSSPSRAEKKLKYGTQEMTNLLISQYPPVFHAATNIPAFVAAFTHLINLTHLTISCPGYGFDKSFQHHKTAVDYALISLRIAIERAPIYSLHSLSMHPIHPSGLLYLHPMQGFGSTTSSAKRWSQIRHLSICMEALPSGTPRSRIQSLQHLRTLHAYLLTHAPNLTRLFFRWKGPRGPSPLSLDKEPCMLAQDLNLDQTQTHPSLRPSTPPKPLRFSRLRTMQLENAIMDSSQISDFIHRHRRTLSDFNFEDVKLRQGNWDDALEPLTLIAGSDRWKRRQEEVMDVPIVLSPTRGPPMRLGELGLGVTSPTLLPAADLKVMGTLIEEVDAAIEVVNGNANGNGGGRPSFSRWLGKPRGGAGSGMLLRKSPNPNVWPNARDVGAGVGVVPKESFWGSGEHVKRLLNIRFAGWK